MSVHISVLRLGGEVHLVLGYALKRPRAFATLTAAELEVAEAIIEGLAPRALAQRRGVSERTVTNQVARIYRKLRVASKNEFLALVGGSLPASGD